MIPQDIAGRKVLNRYKIVEKIGGGGMSVVWKAYDMVLDRNVALKILRPEMSEDEDFVRRFRREAQSVASLSHPNIVNIYDVGEDRGLYFIVMELIGEGETLRDKLKAQGRLEIEEALGIAAEICEALSHAHARRIIHRDIKPQNILLTKQGRVRVADFGIARALGGISTTSTDTVIGSAPYISPEQARNGMVSTRSDLYSLGVVLYEMLSGRVPFAGDSPVAVALQHVEADAPSLRQSNPSIPLPVDELVRKAMAKDPMDRFQSADEMLDAIERVRAARMPAATRERKRDEAQVAGGDGELAKGRKKRVALSLAARIFLSVVAVAVIAACYAVYRFNTWMSQPTVEVPDVVKRSQIEAQSILKNVELVLQVSGEGYDSEAPAGTVLSQSPQAGEKVKKGRVVYVYLSKGKDFAKVPDIMGKRYPTEVHVLLQNAGVQVGDVKHASHPTIPKDHVIGQNPRAGLDVPKDFPVEVTVSTGPEVTTAKVPNVTGIPRDEARRLITDALLDEGTVAFEQSSTVAEGTVLNQDPPAGSEVPLRTKVNLLVAGKSSQPKHFYTKTLSPKDVCADGKAVRVVVSVTDLREKDRVVYDRVLSPDDPEQTVWFEWEGATATVKTDIGGRVTVETVRP